MQSTITATALHARLSGSQEIALLDVREASDFVRAHLNLARHLPLSQLELLAAKVLPRWGTPIVVCDDNGGESGFAERAAALLARLGYTDVALLAGGVAAWQAQGLPTSAGYGTFVRAFADQARLHFGIDTITPTQLHARLASGRSTTVIDVRPAPEFSHASIPGACNHQGMELARMDFSAPDPEHLWVINCFSRTRGVIGTSTLKILGGLRNVAFLEDGVMSWYVHGFDTAHGAAPAPPLAEQGPDALRAQADSIIAAHGLSVITPAQLDAFRRDGTRTLYVFDVRLPTGQAGPAGHDSSDIQCVPGGQLLMHYDTHVGTRHARLVLVDDEALLRAAVCAFWLSQLADGEVHILRGQPTPFPAAAPPPAEDDGRGMAVEELRAHLDAGRATVVDVGPSVEFEKRHIPGAHYMLRSALPQLPVLAQLRAPVVFVSSDGRAAQLAARDMEELLQTPARWLRGGTEAWARAGQPVASAWTAAQQLTPFWDDWGSVMRLRPEQRAEVYPRYLEWERGVAARAAADATVQFRFRALQDEKPGPAA